LTFSGMEIIFVRFAFIVDILILPGKGSGR